MSNSSDTFKIGQLIPDTKNANLGTERGRKLLEESLREYGAGRSILIDKHNRIIAGNKTHKAALEAGFKNVVVIPSDGKHLIAIQRTDLDLEEDDRARILALADNRVGELSLSWNPEILQADVDLLATTNLWNETELALINDDFDLAAFESMGQEPAKEDKKRVEVEKTGEQSDMLPFHVLLSSDARERLFQAINEAKSKHGLETTAEALDVIVQEYLSNE